jgi:cold shock CspA family protein
MSSPALRGGWQTPDPLSTALVPQAVRMHDFGQADAHLRRALAVLNDAFERRDTDDQLTRRLARVLDERMYVAMTERSADTVRDTAEAVERHWNRLRNLEFRHLERFKQIAGTYFGLQFHEPVQASCQKEQLDGYGDNPVGDSPDANAAAPVDRLAAVIRVVGTEALYGFIRAFQSHDWFFHRRFLANPAEWWTLRRGDRVTFVVGRNNRGPCAVDVTLGSRKNDDSAPRPKPVPCTLLAFDALHATYLTSTGVPLNTRRRGSADSPGR